MPGPKSLPTEWPGATWCRRPRGTGTPTARAPRPADCSDPRATDPPCLPAHGAEAWAPTPKNQGTGDMTQGCSRVRRWCSEWSSKKILSETPAGSGWHTQIEADVCSIWMLHLGNCGNGRSPEQQIIMETNGGPAVHSGYSGLGVQIEPHGRRKPL